MVGVLGDGRGAALALLGQGVLVPLGPGVGVGGTGGVGPFVGVLAPVPGADAMAGGVVPQESGAGVGQRVAAVVGVAAGVVADRAGEVLVDECLSQPLVAIGGHRSRRVDVVQQRPFNGQGVIVRGGGAAELGQGGSTVTAGVVAEDLVVGAVLLDDEEHVLDRRGVAVAAWNGHGRRALRAAGLLLGPPGGPLVVLPHLLAVVGHLVRFGDRDGAYQRHVERAGCPFAGAHREDGSGEGRPVVGVGDDVGAVGGVGPVPYLSRAASLVGHEGVVADDDDVARGVADRDLTHECPG